MGQMLPRPAYLPNSLIRLMPDRFKKFDQVTVQRPGGGVGSNANPPRMMQGIHDFSIDIELQLPRR